MDLKQAAERASMTGAEIASSLGVTGATASRWLNRKSAVPDTMKRRFADLLGITVDDLLPEPTTAQGLNHATSEGLEEQERQQEGGGRG